MPGRQQGRRSQNPAKKPFTRDLVILLAFGAAIILIFLALVFRMVIMGGTYSSMADDQHLKTSVDVARRGTIYDRNGEVVASSVESVTINVNPNDIAYSASVSEESLKGKPTAQTAVAKLFAQYLGEEYDKQYADYYEMVTRKDTAYVIIQRKADLEIVNQLKEALAEQHLQGVYYEEDSTRIYPNGDVGSQVIGAVDIDGVGIAGLEMQYDDILAGEDGSISEEKSDSGIPIAGGLMVVNEATDGVDIVTSLDIKLQQRAEESLKAAVEYYEAQGGSVTVMDASTGEIYAAASFTQNKDEETSEVTYDYDVGKLWSVSDTYEPGSTFKSLTAMSVMANGVTADSTFYVPSSLDVYDSVVTDSHDHGDETLTFRDIIAESSNIGTVQASREVSDQTLYDTYSAFGFGQDTGIDFPGSAQGVLETPDQWDGVQEANIVFGQGVSVTGMQLVRAYGAIEQNGNLRTPHFLLSIPNDSEKSEELLEQLRTSTTVADGSVCDAVTDLLGSVVEYGTGTDAAIEGYTVVGKTGTAEIASPYGGYLENAYIVSFCGWVEGSGNDLICLVTIDEPHSDGGGGPVCGPVFAEIMQFAADRY